ncbi:putative signal transducing protein [Shivajiella indica]|uniref:Signal transducing protein n=1 Tax=Shivajiella indica TaxID=872115 RepID=A0ABW5B211_9BACT
MKNWKKVFEDGSPVRAEIVKGFLEDCGIQAVILNKKESVYQIHGQYEVMVPYTEALKAINIVKNEISF